MQGMQLKPKTKMKLLAFNIWGMCRRWAGLGKRIVYGLTASTLVMLSFPLHTLAEEDTTPPTVTSFTVSSQQVDVTTAPQTIQLEVQATDDISGVYTIGVRAASETHRHKEGYANWTVSGSNTWSGTMQFPQYIANGQWKLMLTVADKVGNTTHMEGQTLVDNNYPGFIQVTSNEDITPPVIHEATINPDEADVRSTTKIIEARIRATDDVSGAMHASLAFVSPNINNPEVHLILSRLADEQGNAEWVGSATVPQHVSSGTWLGRISVSDQVGNTTYMVASLMAQHGFDHQLSVISNEDVTPPTAENLTFTPDNVDVSTAPQQAYGRVKSLDDMAGVQSVSVMLTPPSRQNNEIGAVFSLDTNAGEDGIWTGIFHFPEYIESGDWMARLIAVDKVGNQTYMDSDQLAAAGLPNKITVTNSPPSMNMSLPGLPIMPELPLLL